MNYLKFTLSILLCVLLASCGANYTKNETILRAESLLTSFPDSSFHLLCAIPHPEKMNKADYAAWCLQYTHAQYKLYMDIKSDSIIRIAVNYYDNTNLRKQSGRAYYLLGCILKSNKKNKEALLALKKAEFLLQNIDDNDIKGLIDSNIGSIYLEDEIFSQTLIYYNKSLNHHITSKNKKYQAYAYRVISDVFFRLNYPFKRVMQYSNLALQLSKQAGDTANYYSILAQQGELLYNRDYARSKEYLLKGYRFFPLLRPNYATMLSFTYSKLNKPDSARFYLDIASKNTLESKYKVAQFFVGAYVARDEGDINKAFNLYEKAYSIRNNYFEETIRNQLYKIDKQYDLTQKEEENTQLKIGYRNMVIAIALLIIIVLTISIILLVRTNNHKKKQLILAMEKQQLQHEINVKMTENSQKRELLLSKLQNKVGNTLQFNRLKMGITIPEKQDTFLKEITKQSIMTDTEWQYYMEEVNHIFDEKIKNLQKTNLKLTDSDIKVITLICLKLDISDCCSLLNMNKNAMYHRRNIIKERIGIDKDVDLEDWIFENLVKQGLDDNS